MSDEAQATESDTDTNSDGGSEAKTNPATGLQRSGPPEDDGQDYIDRSSIDFDPDEGLLSGTAIDGDSDIPGPHERGDDTGDTGETGENTDSAERTDGAEHTDRAEDADDS